MSSAPEQAIAAALRVNRGQTPSLAGNYVCYVHAPSHVHPIPEVLHWSGDTWQRLRSGMQHPESDVVSWFGPVPIVENNNVK